MDNSGIMILIVDGAASGLDIKSHILREAGYTVIEADSGADALRLISKAKPQLALLSVNLPDISGLEVGRRIKTDPATASTLVLLVSASFVGCDKRARSLEEGADGYLLEPVTPGFLLANIKTLLRLRKGDTDKERMLADERRQAGALKKLASAALAINSAASIDEILQLVTNQAREIIGAHQAVSCLGSEKRPTNVLGINAGLPETINAVSLSEKYAALEDVCDGRHESWVCALVCRLNLPMRLTQAELEAHSIWIDQTEGPIDRDFESREESAPDGDPLIRETMTPCRGSQSWRMDGGLAVLEQVVTPRELATFRELAALREVSALREVATSYELAALREMAVSRNPQILRGIEMRGWLAAPLTSRDGRNLGLIQISEKYEDEFTEQDEAILVQLAQMVSIAVENRRLFRLEQSAREAAENAARAKDEFLAIISHKLRTPLNAMLGWAWVLQRQKGGAETVARAAEIIERNARAQARLVEELLEASRVSAGKLRLDFRPLEIVTLVDAVYGNLRPAAEAKGVELKVKIDPQIGMITGDRDRLQQVIWNLISNAIRFTPEGGHVETSLECDGGDIRLTVSDTGKGISAEALPVVFDPFHQGVAPGVPRPGGLGLGLAMVRHLVEMHGGSVSASSLGEGCGATFTVNLPVNAFRAEQEEDQKGDWEPRMYEKWEGADSDITIPSSPHFPSSRSPSSASRSLAAGGGC